jgi:uncharacterized protein YecE (DUF72 family)
MTLFVGTSGFSYAEWVGDFYPPKTPAGRFLAEYATRLNAVEINNTFQRLPRDEALAKWIADTPPGFKLCLKGHRALTYSAAAFPKAEVAGQFGTRVAALGDRAGPILLQFPPTQKRNPELLESLLANLGRPAAVEFRDPGWLDQEVYSVVTRQGGAVVVTDQEDWPLAEPAGEFGYYRLRRDYSVEELEPWQERVMAEAPRRDVYVFFRHSPLAPERAVRLLAASSSAGKR